MSSGSDSAVAATVVVCTFDRPALLRGTLESLCRDSSGPATWELLLVDNGGFEATKRVAAEFAGRLPLCLIREERIGKSHALNAAVRSARGDLLLFTDDDAEVRPGWRRAFVAAAARVPEAGWFGGRSVPRWSGGTPEWTQRDLPDALRGYACSYDLGSPERTYGESELAPIGACMAVRAATFAAIGGYDPELGPRATDRGVGDDTELVLRARRHGIAGYWVPEAVVDHHVSAERMRALAVFRYGRIKGQQQASMTSSPHSWMSSVVRIASQLSRGALQRLRGKPGNALVCVLNAGLAWGAARRAPWPRG